MYDGNVGEAIAAGERTMDMRAAFMARYEKGSETKHSSFAGEY
jgi:hypothetical protein